MALNLMRGVSVHPKPPPGLSRPPPIAVYLMIPKHKHLLKFHHYYYYYNCSPISSYPNRPTAQSRSPPQGTETTGVEEEEEEEDEEKLPTNYSGSSSSARTQLEFLEQLTSNSPSNGYESDHGSSRKLTIRDQLSQLVGERDDDDDDDGDFSIQLGKKNLKKVSPKFLTISQKRNIKRQAYMDEVSQRNDTVFFATIGAFVILPPLIILGIAIITGYVQLFP